MYHHTVKHVKGEMQKSFQIVKEAREALGMNKSQFARALRVSPALISMIESGDREPTDNFMISVRALASGAAAPSQENSHGESTRFTYPEGTGDAVGSIIRESLADPVQQEIHETLQRLELEMRMMARKSAPERARHLNRAVETLRQYDQTCEDKFAALRDARLSAIKTIFAPNPPTNRSPP